MKALIKNIEQWAEDRNLVKGSTPQKQLLKLYEEFGELCSGVAKNKPEVVKDSIGDCFVVAVILSRQISFGNKVDLNSYADVKTEFKQGVYKDSSVTEQLLDAAHNMGGLAIPILQGFVVDTTYLEIFCINLILIALFNNIDFKDCVKYAYNQIKDRKGKMIDGVFVKEEDL